MTTRSLIPLTLAALMAANLAGLIVGVHDGFASLGPGVANGAYTTAPLPIYALQIAGLPLLLAGRRRSSAVGGGLVLLACTVSLAAVLFDGDFSHAGLGAVHVGTQSAITSLPAILWGLPAAHLVQRRRATALAPA